MTANLENFDNPPPHRLALLEPSASAPITATCFSVLRTFAIFALPMAITVLQ